MVGLSVSSGRGKGGVKSGKCIGGEKKRGIERGIPREAVKKKQKHCILFCNLKKKMEPAKNTRELALKVGDSADSGSLNCLNLLFLSLPPPPFFERLCWSIFQIEAGTDGKRSTFRRWQECLVEVYTRKDRRGL